MVIATAIFVLGCFGCIIINGTATKKIEYVSMKVFSTVSVMSTKTSNLYYDIAVRILTPFNFWTN